MEFVETIKSKKIAKHSYIIVQEYLNDDEQSIYNVSIEESEDGFISETTDLFETQDINKALSFFKILTKIYNYGKENN